MSKYLYYGLDSEGIMNATYKSNAMAFFRNSAGMFVIPTLSSSWESNIAAYYTRGKSQPPHELITRG